MRVIKQNSALRLSGGWVEQGCVARRGDDLSNHTEIISKEERSQRGEDADEEL